ncbi:MAG: RluA family pseudouridine synthase, partial [Candidatus Pacebacteria bacterium CG10_big_fil_rev_8_21_14_0_10_45_6]
IDKPSGLITHPSRFVESQYDVANTVSVSAWVLKHTPSVWGVGEYANRPGIVHRLDKETSGLMVIVKNQKMFAHVKDQFKSRKTEKQYITLAHGVIEEDSGVLDFEIAMGKDGKMAARPKVRQVNLQTVRTLQKGKDAVTEYEVMQRFAGYTLVRAKPRTGRTHQIRVHFFAYNHPLVGDPVYVNKKIQHARDRKLGRLFLHSHKLAFSDLMGEQCNFESKLPPELTSFIDKLT